MFFELWRNRVFAGSIGLRFDESHSRQTPEIALVQQRFQTDVEDFEPQGAEGEEWSTHHSVYLRIKVGVERNKFPAEQPVFSFFHTHEERTNITDNHKRSDYGNETKGQDDIESSTR